MRKCPAVRLNVKESWLLIGYWKFSPTTIDRQNKNYESRFTNIVILYLKYINIKKPISRGHQSIRRISQSAFSKRKKTRILNFGENWNNYRKTDRNSQPDLRLDPTHSRNQNQIQNETVRNYNLK